MVRCGACRTEFDVPGPGRYACPTCNATNEVRAAGPPTGGGMAPPAPGGMAPGGLGGPGLAGAAGSPPAQESPPANVTKVTCDACSFAFFVGEIDMAVCPNCSAEVAVAPAGGDDG